MIAPVVSGWSILPGGTCTHWKSAAFARRTPIPVISLREFIARNQTVTKTSNRHYCTLSSVITKLVNSYQPFSIRTSAIRFFKTGNSSLSNHGFLFNHILLRGLGCGSGMTVGHLSRHAITISVSDLSALGR